MDKFLEKLSKKLSINVVMILFVTLILLIPMIFLNTNIYNDNGIQHISRVFGTDIAFRSSETFPNIIPNFANGFGYSWNLFYSPLTAALPLMFKLIVSSHTMCYKLFLCLSIFLSGITMYVFTKKVSQNKKIALLSSIVYMCMPYHMSCLYITYSITELVGYVCIPLVFLGLYNLFNDKDKSYYFIFGFTGLLLTNFNLCIIASLFSVIYIFCNTKKMDKKVVVELLKKIIFIILISAFFIVPLIESESKSDYQLFRNDITEEKFLNGAIQFNRLLATPSDAPIVYELGIFVIIALGFASFALRYSQKECKKNYIIFTVFAVLSVIMSLKNFPWKYSNVAMNFIQKPTYFIIFLNFFVSFVISINLFCTIKNFKSKDIIVITIILMLYLGSLTKFISYRDNEIIDIGEWELGKISGKVDEVVAGLGEELYLPVKAYENRFYIATRNDYTYVLEGKSLIENEKKDGTNMSFKIETFNEDTVFELPYIYYIGYNVTLDGEPLETFETDNGFLGVNLEKESRGTIDVVYTGTVFMKVAYAISVVSLMVLFIDILKKR